MPQPTTTTLSTVRSSSSPRRCSSRTMRLPSKWPQQGVGDGLRLLGDLLVHEELEAALLGGVGVPVDVEGAEVGGPAAERADVVALGGDRHELVLAELDGLPGVRDERGDVAGDEHLAVADADHQRRVAAGRDQLAGGVGVHRDQRERAVQPSADGGHRGRQVTRLRVVLGGQQVRDDLGVGVAGQLDAGALQCSSQRREVLDDAVVDDRDPAGDVPVRVRVAVGGAAVGGPAGVSDAGGAGQLEVLVERSASRGWPAPRPCGRRRPRRDRPAPPPRPSRNRGTPSGAGRPSRAAAPAGDRRIR